MKVVMPIKRKQEKIWKNDLNIIFIIIYLHKNKIFILNKHFFIIILNKLKKIFKIKNKEK